LREKFYWPVEWLAYLAQTIFRPLGRRLDGEIEWWDAGTTGTIRLEDSCLTIARFEPQDVRLCEFECASCTEALEGGRPTGVPVSDEGLSESAKEILALLPVGCTWAHAALARGHLIGRCHDPVAMNDVLQRLPACEPVHRRFCLEQNIESAKEIRDFLKTVESTQVTLAWDRIVQLLAEGGVVNPHWYVDRYDSDEPWEWNCHRDVLVSIPKLVGDVVDAAVEGHEEPKSAWEILKQYCDVV